MHRLPVVLFVLVALTTNALCQRISMVKYFGGTRFEMDTLTLSPRQVSEILKEQPVAYEEFKKARSNYSASGILGFAGGLLVAIPLGTALAGGKPEWTLAVAGGALIVASIPLSKAFHRHAQNALDEYNKKFPTSAIHTNLYLCGTGAKLVIRF